MEGLTVWIALVSIVSFVVFVIVAAVLLELYNSVEVLKVELTSAYGILNTHTIIHNDLKKQIFQLQDGVANLAKPKKRKK